MDDYKATLDANLSNGAAGSVLPRGRTLGSHAKQIQHDAGVLATEVRDTRADLESFLSERMKQQPYATLGVALGAGYVLGGGLRSRFTAVLLGAAARLATVLVAREISERVSPTGSDPTWTKNV